MRSRNNVFSNVQDNKQHNFKRCNFQHKGIGGDNLNRIQCLKCKDFGHIQFECSKFSRKQIRIYNVINDGEGESNQAHNVVTFKDMKEVINIGESSNAKKMCITSIQKIDYRMSDNKSHHLDKHVYQKTIYRMIGNKSQHSVKHVYQKIDCKLSNNMSQHRVKHHYQCINFFYYTPLYYFKLHGIQPHH